MQFVVLDFENSGKYFYSMRCVCCPQYTIVCIEGDRKYLQPRFAQVMKSQKETFLPTFH